LTLNLALSLSNYRRSCREWRGSTNRSISPVLHVVPDDVGHGPGAHHGVCHVTAAAADGDVDDDDDDADDFGETDSRRPGRGPSSVRWNHDEMVLDISHRLTTYRQNDIVAVVVIIMRNSWRNFRLHYVTLENYL